MKIDLKETFSEITLYAAAMSFYTIFAMVPILLIILSIVASSPMFNEFYDKLEHFIISNLLPTNEELIRNYLRNFLTNSADMGIVGGIYVVITSILFFNNFERIIIKIFKQPQRTIWEKIQTYWTMITMFPILLSIAFYIMIKIQFFLNSYTPWLNLLYFAPFLIIWLTFFLAYEITLIGERTSSTIIVSFLVTLTFFISKNVFLYYITLNKTYSSLYGSISVLIFIFLWTYINWIIFISGIYAIKFLDETNLLQKFTDKFLKRRK